MSADADFTLSDLSLFTVMQDDEFDPADLEPFVAQDGTVNDSPDIVNVAEGLRLMLEYSAKHRRTDFRFADVPGVDVYKQSIIVGFPFGEVEAEMQQKLNFLGWGGDSLSGDLCEYRLGRTGR